MIEIFLQFKKSVDGSTKEFRMAESVSNVFVFFLGFNGNIILISFCMIVISCDGAIESLFFPLNNVFKPRFLDPRSISDESVLIQECPSMLSVNISSRKTEIG
jgi:hypothetical protein